MDARTPPAAVPESEIALLANILALATRNMSALSTLIGQLSLELGRSADPHLQQVGQRALNDIAQLAGDLRRIVREQVKAGRSDREIRAFLVQRYGEFVLLKPRFSAGNAVLWLAPAGVLLVGGGLMFGLLRRRETEPSELSQDEEERVKRLLEDD